MISEISVLFQGISVIALLKIAVDLGKIIQKVDSHEKRLDNIEQKIF